MSPLYIPFNDKQVILVIELIQLLFNKQQLPVIIVTGHVIFVQLILLPLYVPFNIFKHVLLVTCSIQLPLFKPNN